MSGQTIKLQTNDGDVFEVEVGISEKSSVLKSMGGEVIQWATYHKDDPAPPEDDGNRDKNVTDISTWDQDFLKVDLGTLFELILAANYLDIKDLLDVTCKAVTGMIKSKAPEEIRRTFNVKNEFTPQEVSHIYFRNESQQY